MVILHTLLQTFDQVLSNSLYYRIVLLSRVGGIIISYITKQALNHYLEVSWQDEADFTNLTLKPCDAENHTKYSETMNMY